VGAVTVVVATRDRCHELDETLGRLSRIDAPVVVVDNASSDGTTAMARALHPSVTVVRLPRNLGAAARTVGARWASTPLVAFSDDDSWWEPGALDRAAASFAADEGLGLVAARVVVLPEGITDPTSLAMAAGPLDERLRVDPEGRRAVTGFLACAAVVRRSAFLAAGGFVPHLIIGGEEELVTLDLMDAGWKLVYEPEVVAVHRPSASRDGRARRRLLARNHLLVGCLRLPPAAATRRLVPGDRAADELAGRWRAARSMAWAASQRRPVRPEVARALAAIGAPAAQDT
jgi:N-acetylglucosaminyl-diphospho-decaprenol L-rhamnosyltransferase